MVIRLRQDKGSDIDVRVKVQSSQDSSIRAASAEAVPEGLFCHQRCTVGKLRAALVLCPGIVFNFGQIVWRPSPASATRRMMMTAPPFLLAWRARSMLILNFTAVAEQAQK
jgi:hypothetical protein